MSDAVGRPSDDVQSEPEALRARLIEPEEGLEYARQLIGRDALAGVVNLDANCRSAPVAADEGLWLFNQFPKDQIKQKYNVDITDQFVENLRLASLRIGGASGAFVSPQGLILTSRRAVSECAAKAGDVFYAAAGADETKCTGLTADVLVTLEDIIEDCDLVLIMSVNPGFGGQSFIPRSLAKLREARALIDARKAAQRLSGPFHK